MKVTDREYQALCDVVDEAKMEADQDTDVYVCGILDALNLKAPERDD